MAGTPDLDSAAVEAAAQALLDNQGGRPAIELARICCGAYVAALARAAQPSGPLPIEEDAAYWRKMYEELHSITAGDPTSIYHEHEQMRLTLAEARASLEQCQRALGESQEHELREKYDEAIARAEAAERDRTEAFRLAGEASSAKVKALERAEKAERERDEAREQRDYWRRIAETTAPDHPVVAIHTDVLNEISQRAEAAEASLSTAREALENIIGEFDDGEDDPVARIAREALASLAGGAQDHAAARIAAHHAAQDYVDAAGGDEVDTGAVVDEALTAYLASLVGGEHRAGLNDEEAK